MTVAWHGTGQRHQDRWRDYAVKVNFRAPSTWCTRIIRSFDEPIDGWIAKFDNSSWRTDLIPLISVVITTYNRAQMVLGAIESVITHTYHRAPRWHARRACRDRQPTVILANPLKRTHAARGVSRACPTCSVGGQLS
jgi:hypothetical protein